MDTEHWIAFIFGCLGLIYAGWIIRIAYVGFSKMINEYEQLKKEQDEKDTSKD